MSNFLDEIEAAVPALRRYARALTRDADRADDLVQDTLERAIRKRALWRPTGPLQAWLFRMLLNIYRNDLRGQRRRGTHLALDAMGIEPATPASANRAMPPCDRCQSRASSSGVVVQNTLKAPNIAAW